MYLNQNLTKKKKMFDAYKTFKLMVSEKLKKFNRII